MGRIQDPYNNGNHDLTIVGAGGQGLMDNDGVADFNSDINVTGDILVDGSVMSSGENNASTVWIDTSLSAGGDLLIEGNTDSVFDQALINVQGDLNVVVDGAFVDHPSLVHSANTSLDADLAINSFSTQNVSDLNQIRVESLNAVQLDGRDIQNSIENSEAALFSALGSIVQTSFSTPLTLKDMQLMLKNEMRMIQNRP